MVDMPAATPTMFCSAMPQSKWRSGICLAEDLGLGGGGQVGVKDDQDVVAPSAASSTSVLP